MKMATLLIFFLFSFSAFATKPKACQDKFDKAFLLCQNSYVADNLCPHEYDVSLHQCVTNYHDTLPNVIQKYGYARVQSYCPKMDIKACEKTSSNAYCTKLISTCLNVGFVTKKLSFKENCPKMYKKFADTCMAGKFTSAEVTQSNFQERCPIIYAGAVEAKQKCEALPTYKEGELVDAKECGDCKASKVLVKNGNGSWVWKMWNGFDLSIDGSFKGHIVKLSECKTNPKIKKACNVQDAVVIKEEEIKDPDADVIDEQPVVTVPETQTCYWLESTVSRVKATCPECKNARTVCTGRVYCPASKDQAEKTSNVLCGAPANCSDRGTNDEPLTSYSCPSKPEDCMADMKTGTFEIGIEESGKEYKSTVIKN
ncbi:MAG: hypothetical protein ACOYL6_00365 [Bacteriovoracaceae bacterium]